MEEIWKDIQGYEGMYMVSNIGRVKSLSRIIFNGKFSFSSKEMMLSIATDKLGYKRLNLCKDRKVRQWLVHRLVAEAFIPNPENLLLINHKDENPENNEVSNLEWCNHKYNMNYGTAQERRSASMIGKMINRPDKSKAVLQFTKQMKFIKKFVSIQEATRATNINQSNISACCRGVKNHSTVGGYIWRYADGN